MSTEFDTESPGQFDLRTLNRETLNRGIGRTAVFLIKDSENVARDPGQILDWQVFPEGMAATTSKS